VVAGNPATVKLNSNGDGIEHALVLLVVESDPRERQHIERVLQEAGESVVVAENVTEAKHLAHQVRFDGLVCASAGSGWNASDVVRAVADGGMPLPVIIIGRPPRIRPERMIASVTTTSQTSEILEALRAMKSSVRTQTALHPPFSNGSTSVPLVTRSLQREVSAAARH
jgi:DNA-binding response OmpR family regulator